MNCFMLSSLPCFYIADLLSLLPTFLTFFSCSCHFFSSRCMLELKFAIYYRVACPPSQAVFKHSPHTNSISNSAILHNNYIPLLKTSKFKVQSDLYACVHVNKKWRRKGSHSSSVSGSPRVTSNLEKSDGLVHCSVKNAAVLCENHREKRVTQI